jgi:hypothetical protein
MAKVASKSEILKTVSETAGISRKQSSRPSPG